MGNRLVLTQLLAVISTCLCTTLTLASTPPVVIVPDELIAELAEAERSQVVAIWEHSVEQCKESPALIECLRQTTMSLKPLVDAPTRTRFYTALTSYFCQSSEASACDRLKDEMEAAFLSKEQAQSSPYGSVIDEETTERSSSPYDSPVNLDSPYGDPVDLGAVGESEMQLPWLAASPEQEDIGELGLLALDWNVSGRSIIHVRLEDKSRGSFYNRQVLTPGLARYQNSANLTVEARYGELTSALDVDVDWIGYSNTVLSEVGDFPGRPSDELVGIELNALYVIWDDVFGVPGVGFKFGQQRVQWGVADQFNPTNTINPNDLRDVLLFGQQASNLMAAMDVSVWDDWVLDLVWIPSFRAALLPKTGDVSVVSVDRVPFYDENLRWRLHVDRELARAYNKPTVVEKIVADTPTLALDNQSVAMRVSGLVGRQDVSLSYALGFRDLPVPTSTSSIGRNTEICSGEQCIDGLIANEVVLEYPRQQVVGLNVTGEIPTLGGSSVGYRFEAALTIPEKMRAAIELTDVQVASFPAQNGPYDYVAPDGGLAVVYDDAPFMKWTLGFDYTLTREVYLNAMWVHGFVDEFGAGDWLLPGAVDVRAGGSVSSDSGDLLDCRGLGGEDAGSECITEWYRPKIADYLVVGADYRFAENRALLRLFAIWEISGYTYSFPDRFGERQREDYMPWEKEAFSAVFFPQFSYFFSNGFEAEVGGLFALGRDYTRFGDPAVGGSLVWSRFRVRY